MTIITAFRQGNKAYLLTDKAWVRDNGEVHWIDSKFLVGGAFPWGVAFTGSILPQALVRAITPHAPRNARMLVDTLVAALRTVTAEADAEGNKGASCGLYSIMWSARTKQPAIICVDNDGASFGEHTDPFRPFEVDWIMGGVGDPSSLLGRPVNMTDPTSFDPKVDGVALMKAQREVNFWPTPLGPRKKVGGGVQLMSLSRRSTQYEDLHTWPDVVGELIGDRTAV
jgi:hypothetical protein